MAGAACSAKSLQRCGLFHFTKNHSFSALGESAPEQRACTRTIGRLRDSGPACEIRTPFVPGFDSALHSLSPGTQLLRVQLTSEDDPFFLHTLEVCEEDFQTLKVRLQTSRPKLSGSRARLAPAPSPVSAPPPFVPSASHCCVMGNTGAGSPRPHSPLSPAHKPVHTPLPFVVCFPYTGRAVHPRRFRYLPEQAHRASRGDDPLPRAGLRAAEARAHPPPPSPTHPETEAPPQRAVLPRPARPSLSSARPPPPLPPLPPAAGSTRSSASRRATPTRS